MPQETSTLSSRHAWVLALILLIPVVSGVIMLAPERAIILGLANITILLLPLAMLAAWPELRAQLIPRNRVAQLCLLVLAYGVALAFTRAVHTGFSLLTFALWPAALIAGRGMQLAIRAQGPASARAALIALLAAGPLYILLLPVMEALYSDHIDWSRSIPAFNHVRRMGHLLTLSAAAGVGLVAMGAFANRTAPQRAALHALAIVALALAIWTGARGIWLALPAGCALSLGLTAISGVRIRWRALAAVVICACVLSVILPSPGPLLGVVEEIVSTANRLGNANRLTSGRLAIWAETISILEGAPVTGYGWGQFTFWQLRFAIPQVHNMPLEVLLGLGLPMGLLGLGLFAWLWAGAQIRVRRAAADGADWLVPALCILNTMVIYSLVSGVFFYSVGGVLTGLAWGICYAPRPDP